MRIFLALLGIACLLPGVPAVLRPAAVARANDTRGPRWARDWHGPAYSGRTKPWLVLVAGIFFTVVGVFCLYAALALQ